MSISNKKNDFSGVNEIDVTINGNDDYPLKGKLTYGESKENVPLVILVHGSGKMDMDESVGKTKIFRDISYILAKNNIASLRYDNITFAYPDVINSKEYSVEFEVINDAIYARRYMENLQEFKFSKYYVCGHSFGGMMSPKIAEEGSFDGMILLAGSMRSMLEVTFDIILNNYVLDDDAAQKEKLKKGYEEAKRIMELPLEQLEGKRFFNMDAIYLHSIDKYDEKQIIKDIDIPMLVLQGEDDTQIFADKDFVQYEELKDCISDITLRKYQGLGHLFTDSNIDIHENEIHMEEQVIKDIISWIESKNCIKKERNEITNIMKIIHNIWCENLNVEKIGYEENFFLLGGNSLKAINIINSLNKKFNIVPELRLQVMFSSPTIRTLAEKISKLDITVEEKDEEFIGGIL